MYDHQLWSKTEWIFIEMLPWQQTGYVAVITMNGHSPHTYHAQRGGNCGFTFNSVLDFPTIWFASNFSITYTTKEAYITFVLINIY
jgi:hypothetical protein